MIGGLETLIGLAIAVVVIALLGPEAYRKFRKLMVWGKVQEEVAKQRAKEILEKVKKGEISAEEAMKMIDKELGS